MFCQFISYSHTSPTGTPGTLRCFKRLHELYGRLPWARLFQPSIELAERGFPLSKKVAYSIEVHLGRGHGMSPALSDYLVPEGRPARAGEIMRRPRFAATLRSIAENGPDVFYRGQIGRNFVADIRDAGGSLTVDDLRAYREIERQPVQSEVFQHRVLSVGPPTSGSAVIFALKMFEALRMRSMDANADAWQRVAEILKFAFVLRAGVGDPEFNRETVDRAVASMLDDETARRAAVLIEQFVREKDGSRDVAEYTQG